MLSIAIGGGMGGLTAATLGRVGFDVKRGDPDTSRIYGYDAWNVPRTPPELDVATR